MSGDILGRPAGTDQGIARHLTHSLQLLKENSRDPEFARLVDEVLAGRTSLRDVFGSEAFRRTLDPLVEQFSSRYRELDDEERAELAAEGERQLAQLRTEEVEPPRLPCNDDPDNDRPVGRILSSDW